MKEPEYYNQNGLSPLTAFKKGLLSENETLGFIKGNIIKYVVRAGVKTSDAENDIEKAITYLNHLKELLNNSNDEEVDSGTLITYKLREGTDYIVDCIHCSKGLLKKFDLENISDVQELLRILNNHEVLKNINYENADSTFLENKLKNAENKYHELEQDLYNMQEKYMNGFDFNSGELLSKYKPNIYDYFNIQHDNSSFCELKNPNDILDCFIIKSVFITDLLGSDYHIESKDTGDCIIYGVYYIEDYLLLLRWKYNYHKLCDGIYTMEKVWKDFRKCLQNDALFFYNNKHALNFINECKDNELYNKWKDFPEHLLEG